MRRIQRNLPNPARSHSARSSKSSGLLVPEEGVEPTRPCGQRILSPPRLPFRHSGRGKTQHNTQSRSGSTPSQGLAFATQSPRKSQPSNFRHPGTLSSVVSLFVIDSCVISVVKFAMKLSLHSPRSLFPGPFPAIVHASSNSFRIRTSTSPSKQSTSSPFISFRICTYAKRGGGLPPAFFNLPPCLPVLSWSRGSFPQWPSPSGRRTSGTVGLGCALGGRRSRSLALGQVPLRGSLWP